MSLEWTRDSSGVGGWQPESGFVPARNVGQASFEALNISAGPSEISWEFTQGDSGMFDLAAPTLPAPIKAGTYSYLLIVTQQNGDGSPFGGMLVVDNDFYAVATWNAAAGSASEEFQQDKLSVVVPAWFSAAGSALYATIGTAVESSDTFNALLYIQRLA